MFRIMMMWCLRICVIVVSLCLWGSTKGEGYRGVTSDEYARGGEKEGDGELGVLQRLAIANVKPTGWLRARLETQLDGLAGHLSRFWPDVMNSTFIGGNATEQGGMHERAGYWLNGAVPMAFLLDDGIEQNKKDGELSEPVWPECQGGHMIAFNETGKFRLTDEVGCYLYYILKNQNDAGWYGGAASYPGGKPDGNGYWLQWNIVRSLIMYAEGNKSVRNQIAASLSLWLHYTSDLLETVPLAWWSQVRWQDFSDVLLDVGMFLSTQGWSEGDDLAFRTAQKVEDQGFDWRRYYSNPQPPVPDQKPWVNKSFPTSAVPYWDYDWHGVNNAMAIKAGAMSYVLSGGNDKFRNQTTWMLNTIDKYHGRPDGSFNCDECFGGRGSNRGVELCAIVETMYSLQVAFRIHHDLHFLDRIELLMHSSLPGALTNNLWAHNYISQSNEICAGSLKAAPWVTTGYDSNSYGLSPNYGCCTSNFIQGYSKFAMSVIAVSQAPLQHVYISLYAPIEALMPMYIGGGATYKITTEYPVGDEVTIDVFSRDEGITTFLRIPSWVHDATVTTTTYDSHDWNLEAEKKGKPGTFVRIQTPKGQTKIIIKFNVKPYMTKGIGDSNAVSIYRGPILLALPLNERVNIVNQYAFDSKDYFIDTDTKWNQFLVIDQKSSNQVRTDGHQEKVFLDHLDVSMVHNQLSNEDKMCSVSLNMRGGYAANWSSIDDDEITGPMPLSPLRNLTCWNSLTTPAIYNVTLVPYACTLLRISIFPWTNSLQLQQPCSASYQSSK